MKNYKEQKEEGAFRYEIEIVDGVARCQTVIV